ncbi:MAG: phosphomannomutase, partial [Candidatus Aenigmatarchaeota archaeon]
MVIIIKINQLIFREYDIRGIVGKDVDEDVAYIVGRGFASYLIKRGSKEVIVGYDTRETSIPYKEAFIKGLVDSGCIAIDVGYALSSMIYFARKYYDIDGACIITASHNPPEYNGFKLCHGLNAITGEEIQKI